MSAGAVVLMCGSAIAQPINFTAPGFRGVNPNAEYAGFESFSVPFGGPNFPDDPNQNGIPATLTQNTAIDFSMPPGISISGVGNLYSGFQNMNMSLADTAAGDVQTVILQIRTLGTELFYPGIGLSYAGPGGMQTVMPDVSRQLSAVPGPFIFGNPTVNVEWKFKWDLSGNADFINQYSINMTHFAPHLSIDRIELDTLATPTPGSAAVIAVAGIAAGARRRR